MKDLCSKLTSLVPPHHFVPSKELLSQQDQLDQVATYIKGLKERIDELKVKKEVTLMSLNGNSSNKMWEEGSLRIVPVVEVKELGSSLEVVLISGLKKTFTLNQVISVLQEEGTQVASASISTVGNRVFHTLHAQVKITRVGVDTSSISQRLQELNQSTSF